jgi:outer membrane lipoprotein SlyB
MKNNYFFFIFIVLIFTFSAKSELIFENEFPKNIQGIWSVDCEAGLQVHVIGNNSSLWIGATAGGMIGGLLGTQICGEEEIIGTKCQDIAVVYGTIGGAAIGTVAQAMLGNHDGFQYIVNIDNNDKDSAFVQGDKNPMKIGQRVVIIYGNDIRVMSYEE